MKISRVKLYASLKKIACVIFNLDKTEYWFSSGYFLKEKIFLCSILLSLQINLQLYVDLTYLC